MVRDLVSGVNRGLVITITSHFFIFCEKVIVYKDFKATFKIYRRHFAVEGWLMHRGGGVVGGGGAGTAAGRVLELDHPPAIPAGPTGFHWGAMIAGHHAAAAAGMMQPSLSGTADYGLATTHSPAHSTMPMDLHMSQGFPCYRSVLLHLPIHPRTVELMNGRKILVT